MEKLELKHIAGYLPYKLLMVKDDLTPIRLTPLNYNTIVDNEARLPILRPLSDLIKPLEDGSIPAIELAKLCLENKKYKGSLLVDKKGDVVFDYRIITKPFGKVLKVTSSDEWIIYLSFDKPLNIPYFQINYLYEWHFDIHGLIEKGLAIDINTLKQ